MCVCGLVGPVLEFNDVCPVVVLRDLFSAETHTSIKTTLNKENKSPTQNLLGMSRLMTSSKKV